MVLLNCVCQNRNGRESQCSLFLSFGILLLADYPIMHHWLFDVCLTFNGLEFPQVSQNILQCSVSRKIEVLIQLFLFFIFFKIPYCVSWVSFSHAFALILYRLNLPTRYFLLSFYFHLFSFFFIFEALSHSRFSIHIINSMSIFSSTLCVPVKELKELAIYVHKHCFVYRTVNYLEIMLFHFFIHTTFIIFSYTIGIKTR